MGTTLENVETSKRRNTDGKPAHPAAVHEQLAIAKEFAAVTARIEAVFKHPEGTKVTLPVRAAHELSIASFLVAAGNLFPSLRSAFAAHGTSDSFKALTLWWEDVETTAVRSDGGAM